jgi:hypothetical protein
LISDRFRYLYGESLLLEFSDESLAQYRVSYEHDRRHLRDVVPRQLFEQLPHNYARRSCRSSDVADLERLYFESYDPGVACSDLAEAASDTDGASRGA